MPDYIGREPNKLEKAMPFVLGVFVFVMFAIVAPIMASDTAEREAATDCGEMKERQLSELPARCITTEGGFNHEFKPAT